MTISLRNIPPDVEKAIVEISGKEGISLNKAAIQLMETNIKKPFRNHDFDKIFGSCSKEAGEEFDAALAEMRRVDPIDWEPLE